MKSVVKRSRCRHVRYIWFKEKPIGGIVSKCVLKRCHDWDVSPRHAEGYWMLKMLNGSGIDDDFCKNPSPEYVQMYEADIFLSKNIDCITSVPV